jgi:hypothetical protein
MAFPDIFGNYVSVMDLSSENKIKIKGKYKRGRKGAKRPKPNINVLERRPIKRVVLFPSRDPATS